MVHSTGRVVFINEGSEASSWEVGVEVSPPEDCVRVLVELPESNSGLDTLNAQAGPFPDPCVISLTVKRKPSAQIGDLIPVDFAFPTDIM
ncbi:MAG: hypothetical protein JO076_09730 [Verrucomicrobia bacterium]|nr:hypothetical protein [Verrucomicrobiota bacterium]